MKTIKSGSEISRIFKKGKHFGTPNITLIAIRNEKQHGQGGRAAFIAGKRLGNAVWRNRAKRRMRALWREEFPEDYPYDVLLVARKPINEATHETLVHDVRQAKKRIDSIAHGQ